MIIRHLAIKPCRWRTTYRIWFLEILVLWIWSVYIWITLVCTLCQANLTFASLLVASAGILHRPSAGIGWSIQRAVWDGHGDITFVKNESTCRICLLIDSWNEDFLQPKTCSNAAKNAPVDIRIHRENRRKASAFKLISALGATAANGVAGELGLTSSNLAFWYWQSSSLVWGSIMLGLQTSYNCCYENALQQ